MKYDNAILTKLVQDVFKQTSFLVNGKYVENIKIIQYDVTNHIISIEVNGCPFIIHIEKTSVTTKSVTINWNLYLYKNEGNHFHFASGKTRFLVGKDFKPQALEFLRINQ